MVVDVIEVAEGDDLLLDISLIDVTVIVEAEDILIDDNKVFDVSLIVGLTVLIEGEDDTLLDVPTVDDITIPRVVSCDVLSAPLVTGPILLEEDN